MAASDPPFLTVGTEVSAKFKGAFCEAKIKSMKKLVKCKVILRSQPFNTIVVGDELLDGECSRNSEVNVFDNNEWCPGTIAKIFDQSVYTVIFDDGDERILRRSGVKLKGERHFNESENLDNLPLTDPECFGTPVVCDSSGNIRPQSKRKSRDGAHSSNESEAESSDCNKAPVSTHNVVNLRDVNNLISIRNRKTVLLCCNEKKKLFYPVLYNDSPSKFMSDKSKKVHALVASLVDDKTQRVNFADLTLLTKDNFPTHISANVRPSFHRARIMLQEENRDSIAIDEFPPLFEEYCSVNELDRPPRNLDMYKLYSCVLESGGFLKTCWQTLSKQLSGSLVSNLKLSYRKYLKDFDSWLLTRTNYPNVKGAKFRSGERVRVSYQGSKKPYVCKVVSVSGWNGGVKYRVHYAGWNQRYDEWVDESRVLSFFDASEKNYIKCKPTVSLSKTDVMSDESPPTMAHDASTSLKRSSIRLRKKAQEDENPFGFVDSPSEDAPEMPKKDVVCAHYPERSPPINRQRVTRKRGNVQSVDTKVGEETLNCVDSVAESVEVKVESPVGAVTEEANDECEADAKVDSVTIDSAELKSSEDAEAFQYFVDAVQDINVENSTEVKVAVDKTAYLLDAVSNARNSEGKLADMQITAEESSDISSSLSDIEINGENASSEMDNASEPKKKKRRSHISRLPPQRDYKQVLSERFPTVLVDKSLHVDDPVVRMDYFQVKLSDMKALHQDLKGELALIEKRLKKMKRRKNVEVVKELIPMISVIPMADSSKSNAPSEIL